jgi:hypothetical protein
MALYFGVGSVKKWKLYLKLKKSLRVIMGVDSRVFCGKLFRDLKILTLTSLFILQILCFIIKNGITQVSILMYIVTILFTNTIYMFNIAIQIKVREV